MGSGGMLPQNFNVLVERFQEARLNHLITYTATEQLQNMSAMVLTGF